MATQAVIDSLTQTIQDCLEAKLQAGFDANAALTIDIAREVAQAVEDKAAEYTDIEIDKVMNLISGGEVDLGPFTEFMNTIKTLLDGDETTEGYQVFNTLITDTANNKQTLVNHTTSIQLIQQTLATFQTTLTDHEDRIAALEAAQHEPIDCEACHDELLNLVKGSMADACTAADTTVNAHYASESTSVFEAFANELDPITFVPSIDSDSDPMRFLAQAVGRRIFSVTVMYPNSFAVAMVEGEDSEYAIDAPVPLTDGDYLFTAKDEAGNLLASATINRTTAPVIAAPVFSASLQSEGDGMMYETDENGYWVEYIGGPHVLDIDGNPQYPPDLVANPTLKVRTDTVDSAIANVTVNITSPASVSGPMTLSSHYNNVFRWDQIVGSMNPMTLTIDAEYFDAQGVSLGTVTQVVNT